MPIVEDKTEQYTKCRTELREMLDSIPRSIDCQTFLFEHCIGLMMQINELKAKAKEASK